jgi:hypothetical protein
VSFVDVSRRRSTSYQRVPENGITREEPDLMTTIELAQVLFTTALQPSGELSPIQIRQAVDERLCACGGDPAWCAAYVAQEAGDHPETYVTRMRWALDAVADAYALAAA